MEPRRQLSGDVIWPLPSYALGLLPALTALPSAAAMAFAGSWHVPAARAGLASSVSTSTLTSAKDNNKHEGNDHHNQATRHCCCADASRPAAGNLLACGSALLHRLHGASVCPPHRPGDHPPGLGGTRSPVRRELARAAGSALRNLAFASS